VLDTLISALKNPHTLILLLNSALVAAVIRLVWLGITWLVDDIRFRRSAEPRTFSPELDFPRPANLQGVTFSVLIVRYGTDPYIRDMASAAERSDGRLQNAVHTVDYTQAGDGPAKLHLTVPMHRRLGTQFKWFAEPGKDQSVTDLRESLERTKGVTHVSEARTPRSVRVYFLLEEFPSVTTVEGMTHNFVYPE